MLKGFRVELPVCVPFPASVEEWETTDWRGIESAAAPGRDMSVAELFLLLVERRPNPSRMGEKKGSRGEVDFLEEADMGCSGEREESTLYLEPGHLGGCGNRRWTRKWRNCRRQIDPSI